MEVSGKLHLNGSVHAKSTEAHISLKGNKPAFVRKPGQACFVSCGPAMNPAMVAFSSFDANFCAKNADHLKDKKVLMYWLYWRYPVSEQDEGTRGVHSLRFVGN